jgi:predicted metal-dependent phosphoesterase TrpH
LDSKPRAVDLHIHSTASDGSFDPLEILNLAKNTGLAAFALTDHDATSGVQKILAHPALLGPVQFLTGVEISAAPPKNFTLSGSFHLLGYGFTMDHPGLNLALDRQQAARKNRNPEMIRRLNALGFAMTLEDVIAASEAGAQIGRPHIARLMVQKGYCASINDAFDRYIGKGKPAYVEKARIPAAEAIGLIRSAGGIPVLAHPGLLEKISGEDFERLILALKSMGLLGIEVLYPEHSPAQTNFFQQCAEKHDLLITGGSDFHGAINPEIRLGIGKGDLFVPYALFYSLADAIARQNPSGSIHDASRSVRS